MKYAVFVSLAIFAFSNKSLAQNSCYASFDVDSKKSMTYFGWLPSGSDRSGASFPCSSAERMRTKIFIDYLSINSGSILSSPDLYVAELISRRKALMSKKRELQMSLSDGSSIDAVRAVGEVAWYEAGKFFAILGCIAPEPTPVTKAACVYGLVSLARDTWGLSNKFSENDIKDHLKTLDQYLRDTELAYGQALKTNSSSKIAASRERYELAFSALCKAIKDQCLR